MPIYEYECLACGRRSEELQKMNDPPLTTCASCGGELRRLLSSPAFHFKGSGWYVTDYARAKPEGAGKGEPKEKAPEGKKDGAPSGGEAGGKGAEKAGSASKTEAPAKKAASPD